MGASVRGAIDLVRLGRELSALRGEPEPAPGDATFADAAIAALSGRLRLDEGGEQTPEEIVLELIERLVPRSRSRAAGKSRQAPRAGGGRGPLAERRRGARRRQASAAAGRSRATSSPARHAQLEQVSPAVGRLDEARVPRAPALATPTPRSRCSPTSPRPPTRSCASRRGGSRRGCSCAPGGSAPAPAAATGG